MMRFGQGIRISGSRLYSSFTSENILRQALPLVTQHGWDGALIEACRQLRMSDQATSMFAADDLVKFNYKTQLTKLAAYEPTAEGIHAKVRELLQYRLSLNKEIGPDNVKSGIAIILKTHPATSTYEALGEISDEIWFKAGDRSTDTTWYSRRAVLASIYGSCEAFQACDKSRDFRDTTRLANKLMNGLETAEYAEKSVGEWLDFNLRGVMNVLRTWR